MVVDTDLIAIFCPIRRAIRLWYIHEVIIIILMVALSHCATVRTKHTLGRHENTTDGYGKEMHKVKYSLDIIDEQK